MGMGGSAWVTWQVWDLAFPSLFRPIAVRPPKVESQPIDLMPDWAPSLEA